MEIEVREITTKKELKQFVQFQLDLYKGNPYFVPPLISGELESLDPTTNPSFKFAKPHYFLAYKNGKIVGRIAAIINEIEVEKQNIKKIRFGNFDVIDDIEVSKALFAKVEEIARANKLDFMEGPMGATNLERVGMLSFGFDRIATAIAQYNYEYYPQHLEQMGFVKEKEWLEMLLDAPVTIAEKIRKFSDLVTERYELKLVQFKSKNDIKAYIKPVFDLLEETYSELETYVPITEEQKAFYAKKYAESLSPEYLTFIEDKEGKLCAFAIVMPSYAKALQKANGKLFPFGWYHLLKAQKKNDTAEFVLIGIHPQYQRKGITAIIFMEMYHTFQKYNIKHLETNPELEGNQSVQLLWNDYNPEIHKRRKTFKKDIRY